MDGKRISGATGRGTPSRSRKKRSPGLAVVERDGYWHIHGTLRAAGRSALYRKSLGLAATAENRDAAEAEKLRIEREFRDATIHGVRPSVPLGVAADQFLAKHPGLKPFERRVIKEITAEFGLRRIDQIGDDEWDNLVTKRHLGNKPSSRERWLNALYAFLNWCRQKPRHWLAELPALERDTAAARPKHRRARRVAELTPALILFLAQHASPHLKGPLAIMWCGGARVASLLYECRLCDYIAAPGREQLTLHRTKSGEPVVVAVHAPAAALMREYLAWRGELADREAPLFVTPKRGRDGKWLPYALKVGEGGQLKRTWEGMLRRAAATVARDAAVAAMRLRRRDTKAAREVIAIARDRIGLIRQITPHWFRHALATAMLSKGGDIRAVMDQAGWVDSRSPMGYIHDVPERRRAVVNMLVDEEVSAALGQHDINTRRGGE